MRCTFVALLLLAPGVMHSASQEPAKPLDLPSEYLPLQIGKQQKYLVADPQGKGARAVTIKVAREEIVDIKRMVPDPDDKKKQKEVVVKFRGYVLESSSAADRTPQTEVVAVMEDGLYRCAFLGKELTPPICLLKTPPMHGQTWQVQSMTDSQPIQGSFTCERVDDQERLRKGLTDPVVFKSFSSDFQIGKHKTRVVYYFASGRGIVRQEVQVGGYDIVMQLAPKQ